MGHDGPAHLAVPRDPLLRGLGVYHGKRGWGVSVEFDVRHGPVTTSASARTATAATPSSPLKVRWSPARTWPSATRRPVWTSAATPDYWVDEWSQTGIGHHWALCVGHRAADIKAAASLLGIEHRHVALR